MIDVTGFENLSRLCIQKFLYYNLKRKIMGKPSLLIVCISLLFFSSCENKKAIQLEKVVKEKDKQIDKLHKQESLIKDGKSQSGHLNY